jgi:hypothetical protein
MRKCVVLELALEVMEFFTDIFNYSVRIKNSFTGRRYILFGGLHPQVLEVPIVF